MPFDFSLTRSKPTPHIRVAVDLETYLLGPTIQAPPIVAMGFSLDGGKVNIVAANDPAFDRVVEALFADPSCRLFGHNIRYDIACLLAHGAQLKLDNWPEMILGAAHDDRVTCTLIRETLLRIAIANPMKLSVKYNLEACCNEWGTKTRPNKADEWRLKYGQLAALAPAEWPSEVRKYLEEDIRSVDELYVLQGARHGQWLVDQYRQTRASISLYLMQCWGFRTDPVAAEKLVRETEADLAEAAEICLQHGLIRENGTRDLKAATARLVEAFESRGLPVPRGKVTEKMVEKAGDDGCLGNVKLDEDACVRSGDLVLLAYTKASQAATLLSKAKRYCKPVIQASFETVMNTGRTSCRQGTDPKPGFAPKSWGGQLQNLPRAEGVRECLVSRPGRVLLDIDYAAMELRTLAQIEKWLFGSSTLGDILNDPKRCPHVELGAAILEIPVADAYEMKKTDPKGFKQMRQLAKGFNFGGPGGSGAEAMVKYCKAGYDVDISVELARKVLALLKSFYPERQKYLKRSGEKTRTASGRARETLPYSGFVRGGMSFTEYSNFPFQALAATCGKEAMWRVTLECYADPTSPLYGARAVDFIHDQLLVEADEEGFRQAAKRLEELWKDGAQDICPDILIMAETAVSRRWTKAAGDPVFIGGELAIFEDFVAAKG